MQYGRSGRKRERVACRSYNRQHSRARCTHDTLILSFKSATLHHGHRIHDQAHPLQLGRTLLWT